MYCVEWMQLRSRFIHTPPVFSQSGSRPLSRNPPPVFSQSAARFLAIRRPFSRNPPRKLLK
jgi:hypothetical protein